MIALITWDIYFPQRQRAFSPVLYAIITSIIVATIVHGMKLISVSLFELEL